MIRDDDDLIAVDLTDGNSEILMANRNGRAIRFHESKVRTMGRVSTGVRGMRLDDDPADEIVGLITLAADSGETVLTLSEKGYGKRSELDGYRITNRGGKGVRTMNITDRTGHLVAFESVTDDNDLVIINQSGITIRVRVSDIKIAGRATQGVHIINLDKRGDNIASVCCVDTDPEEESTEIEAGDELPEISDVEIEDDTADDTDTESDAAEDDNAE